MCREQFNFFFQYNEVLKYVLLIGIVIFLTTSCTLDARIYSDVIHSDSTETSVEIFPDLEISPKTLTTLLPGEELSFSAIGGKPTLLFADQGSGYLNSLTGVYSAPINLSTPITENISVTDVRGQSALSSVKVQAFQNKVAMVNAVAAVPSSTIEKIIKVGTTLYNTSYLGAPPDLSASSPTPDFTSKKRLPLLLKSDDSGATWSEVAKFEFSDDLEITGTQMLANGSDLYFIHKAKVLNVDPLFRDKIIIQKSSDSGVTKETINEFTLGAAGDGAPRYPTVTSYITNDGELLTISTRNTESNHHIYYRKCHLTTWICREILHTTAISLPASEVWALDIKTDGSNNLYSLTWELDVSLFGAIVIRKSTDNGETWTTLRYEVTTNSFYQSRLAVSADGTYIAYSGYTGAINEFVVLSTNSGSTWNQTTNLSVACWQGKDLFFRANKDLMFLCNFNPSPAVSEVWVRPFATGIWSKVLTESSNNTTVSYISDTEIYSANSDTGLLKVSTNFGSTWTPSGTVRQGAVPLDFSLQSLENVSENSIAAAGFYAHAMSVSRGTVKKSTDGGTTWSTAYSSPTDHTKFISLAKSPTTGNLAMIGYETGTKWNFYRHDVGADTWSLVNSFTDANLWYFTLGRIRANSNGDFYAVGGSRYTVGTLHPWLVRRSTDDGLTWSTVDSFQHTTNKVSIAQDIAFSGSHIYVVGSGIDATNKAHWLVRHYDGSTWTSSDDYLPGGNSAEARSIHISSDGTIYVVGKYTSSSISVWVVKRKVVNGSWEIIDEYQKSSGFSAWPTTITEDTQGTIFVAGAAVGANNTQYGVIRAYKNGKWITIEEAKSGSDNLITSITSCIASPLCYLLRTSDENRQYQSVMKMLSQ
jgi:hypothetical protein